MDGVPILQSDPPDARLGRLAALEEKYDLLISLRLGRPERSRARRDAMAAVSDRFPAALREWDAHPLEELLRRREAVRRVRRRAADGAALEALLGEDAWLRYALDLHQHLRGLLLLRRFARSLGDDADRLRACQDFYERNAEPVWPEPLDPERLRRLLRPGRFTDLAYEDVAAHHGVSAEEIKRALFGWRPAEGGA